MGARALQDIAGEARWQRDVTVQQESVCREQQSVETSNLQVEAHSREPEDIPISVQSGWATGHRKATCQPERSV